jgi:hypothetical protein
VLVLGLPFAGVRLPTRDGVHKLPHTQQFHFNTFIPYEGHKIHIFTIKYFEFDGHLMQDN